MRIVWCGNGCNGWVGGGVVSYGVGGGVVWYEQVGRGVVWYEWSVRGVVWCVVDGFDVMQCGVGVCEWEPARPANNDNNTKKN